MRTIAWIGVGAVCLVGCEKPPDTPAPVVVAAASATVSSAAPPAASASSAAPVASAPSAKPVASAVPSDPPPTEEKAFWEALSIVYDSQLAQCKTGWTGDGEITIKDGKIARFEITYPGEPSKVIAALKGKAVPPIPASLKKLLEKPASISVCSGGYRAP